VRITSTAICGSDLQVAIPGAYNGVPDEVPMGSHEQRVGCPALPQAAYEPAPLALLRIKNT
jgi:hypothetical protein